MSMQLALEDGNVGEPERKKPRKAAGPKQPPTEAEVKQKDFDTGLKKSLI